MTILKKKNEKRNDLKPKYIPIVEIVAKVAKSNYGVFRITEDFESFERELQKTKDKNILKRAFEAMAGTIVPHVDSMTMLQKILKKYMISEFNELELNYDDNMKVFYFETIIKQNLRAIQKSISEFGSVAALSEISERLGVDEDLTNIILNLIKKSETLRGITIIPDRIIKNCIYKATNSGRACVIYADDLQECIKNEIGVEVSTAELKKLINRLKERGVVDPQIEIYDDEDLNEVLERLQYKTDDGLIPAEEIPHHLITLMEREKIILKVCDPGYYLPLYKGRDDLKFKSMHKFVGYIASKISDPLRLTFESNNYITSYSNFLNEIEKFINNSYNIGNQDIQDYILQRVEQEVGRLLNLKFEDSLNGKVVVMEDEFNRVVNKIKQEIVKQVVGDLRIAIEIQRLKERVSKAIKNTLTEYWSPGSSCYEFVKSNFSIDELVKFCKDELTNKGWKDDGVYIISEEISKYKEEILEELKNRGVIIGEKEKMFERVKKELKNILNKYNIDESSKSALEKIIIRTIESLL